MFGFAALTRQRLVIDQREQPLQISEIAAYADYTGIHEEDDREDFMRIVLKLDDVAQRHFSAQQEKRIREQNRKAKARAPTKGRRR